MHVTRRPATPADVAFLENVHVAALLPLVADEATLRRTFHAELQLAMTDVIVADDIEVGYLVLEDHGDIWWIELIAIVPAYQRKGIGTAVLEAVLDAARVPVQLSVLRRNPEARALYERLGFRAIREEDKRVRMEAATGARRR